MAAEYCFDYIKAKPNRFAEGMRVGWTVDRFVVAEKENGKKNGRVKATAAKKSKTSPAKAKRTPANTKSPKPKAKPATSSPKRKTTRKPAAKAKKAPAKKGKKK